MFYNIINLTLSNDFLFIIIIVSIIIGIPLFNFIMKDIRKRNDIISIDLEDGEKILKEGLATHRYKFDNISGKLFLTDRRLVFKAGDINIQRHIYIIKLSSIKNCKKFKHLGFLQNGIKITTIQNNDIKFFVKNPENWLKHICPKN